MERGTKKEKTARQKNDGAKNKKRGKAKMTIVIIISIIAVFMLTGTILQATYFKGKMEKVEPYGQLVDVYDGQMHVYSMGSADKTIVLLPGMGVALPSADFSPLMRKLSENYTVVCVEYFGVGFSSQTSRERTCENYVEEIRAALKEAGFNQPYVLMAHSISSIYSEYYAAKYPDEVEAIISLDGTTTAYYEPTPAIVNMVLPIAKFQQGTGTMSILASLVTNKENLLSNGYTQKDINDCIAYAGFSMNDTVLEQISNSSEFIKQAMELPYPESVPYFKIISKDTYETPIKSKVKMTPQEYQEGHLERIGEHAQFEILEGTHFIYLNNVDKISEITDGFLNNGSN